MTGWRRITLEAGIAAVIAFTLSLLVFGPILGSLDSGWSGGDMLSTYVNSVNWDGFSYSVGTQFGFPLGMNLNYFPGIDITENTFALAVNTLTGSTFLGINLLVLLSFPLVAALAYLTIRMTGLQGPLAVALAVAFAVIPFHWGRALGHTYLSTLYSAVVGVAVVLLVGSGLFARMRHDRPRRQRVLLGVVTAAMVVVVAWTGVYYVAFTLILGLAALVWRFAHRASARALAVDAIPFAGIGVLAAIGFVPALLTLRSDPPLASLGERMASESVTYAGNLAMAILPIPQSSFPRMGYYNQAVVDAFRDAPFGESNVITNFGTWVTTACLLVIVAAVVWRRRHPVADPTPAGPVGLGLITYLIGVVVLFFVPWGLNFLFADLVTAQIRAWNRLLPILLLLFVLGAAAVLARTRVATRLAIAVPIALVIVGVTAVDSVHPFRGAYAASVVEAGQVAQAGRDYATAVNAAIPADCGVLQLPYMAYPENGVQRGINDYDHFWTSITNPGKDWSYGSVKYTDASIWAAQLPDLPTDEQVALLRGAGFCAIHLDLRGFISEERPPIVDNLTSRFGDAVATGFKDQWLLFSIGEPTTSSTSAETTAFLHEPFIEFDPGTVTPRDSDLEQLWWWTIATQATFTFTPTSPDTTVRTVTGAVAAPPCSPLPVTLTLTAGDQTTSMTVIAEPEVGTPFTLTLPAPSPGPATLTVDAPGRGCPAGGTGKARFAQLIDLSAR